MKGQNKIKTIQLIVLVFTIMAVFGLVENIKGAIIPSIRSDFGIDYSSIGVMLFVSTLGYLVSALIGGIAGDKFGQKKVIGAGFIMIISAIAGIFFVDSFVLLSVLMFFINAGFGCFDIGVNSLGAQIFVRNSALMMNFVHFFYGVGASIGPKYAGALLVRNIGWKSIYLYSLIFIVVVFIFMLLSPFPETNLSQKDKKLPLKRILTDKKVWLFVGVLGFCEVAELGMGNWLVNFLQVSRGMEEGASSFYLSAFFIAFTVGRLVGGYLAEKMGYFKILLYFTIIDILLFSGGLLLGSQWTILFSLQGFFVSIMFPTIMAMIMKEYTQGVSSVMGFIITAASTINMVSNLIIGRINDYFSVYAGFASLLIYMALIIVLFIPLQRLSTAHREESLAKLRVNEAS